ncbi:MAG: alpha-E domain-containing protein [Pseudomonadales bacterium]|nr:alpha-E domain-containing protein [Pseudomonadales bacterium]
MLSKVAERIYWIGRYLERVESTARLVSIYDNILFDLPRNSGISWYNLIIINHLEHDFAERYSVRDERNVVKFLLGDNSNPSSVVSSLKAVRENVRTTRDVVLEETWEMTNELSMFVNENIQQGINRRQRHEFLNQVILGCQQIIGMLFGSLPHDAGWHFLTLGRSLERADMTTRILDAAASAYQDSLSDDAAVNTRQIILGHALRVLNADQSYRRIMRSTVNADAVFEFILDSEVFPRAINFCHRDISQAVRKLPRNTEVVKAFEQLQTELSQHKTMHALDDSFRQYLNQLQIMHNALHSTISKTWFPHLS